MDASSERIEQLLDLLKQQQMFLEMYVRSWVDDYRSSGGTVFCGKGCRNCCTLAVHVGFAEAVAVARRLDDTQRRAVEGYAVRLRKLVQGVEELPAYLRLHRQEIGFCPLLNDAGECTVYSVRPLSCRSLISTRERVWCGTDFVTLTPAERDAFVSGLDQKVVAFPTQYVGVIQELGREMEDAGAQKMRNLLGFALYGNLGVLVHLICHHGLAEASLEGADAAGSVIAESGFDHPLLITKS